MHLRKLARAIVAAVVVSSAFASAKAAPILYATGGGGLYTLDPFTGASTRVFDFPGLDLNSGGLAYDAASDSFYATGSAFASSGITSLFNINRSTGAVTVIGQLPASIVLSAGGLAIHPLTGVMYASGAGAQSTELFTIEKATGVATLIGRAGPECCASGTFGFRMNGLGFASDGTLFANGFSSSPAGFSQLFTIDLSNGAATAIGLHGVTLGRQLGYSGLAFREDGTLLSLGSVTASTQGLYAIDPLSAAATLLGPTPGFGVDGGLTFAVPEPGVLGLLGVGFAGLGAMSRRGRRRSQPTGSASR